MFVGLDLGQSHDPSALSVVERAEIFRGRNGWVSFERRRRCGFRVLFLERAPLGTPYPRVVERVRRLCGDRRWRADARWCGCDRLGAPVVDMLRSST